MPAYILRVKGLEPKGPARLDTVVAEGNAQNAGAFYNRNLAAVTTVEGREKFGSIDCTVVQTSGDKGPKVTCIIDGGDEIYPSPDGMNVLGPGPDSFNGRDLKELAKILGVDEAELRKRLGKHEKEVAAALEPRPLDASRFRIRYYGPGYRMDEVDVIKATMTKDKLDGDHYVHVITGYGIPSGTEVEKLDVFYDGVSMRGVIDHDLRAEAEEGSRFDFEVFAEDPDAF